MKWFRLFWTCKLLFESFWWNWIVKISKHTKHWQIRNPIWAPSIKVSLARPINGSLSERFNLAVRIDLDIVGSFCYLGDTIDAGGGCEASVTARIRAAWGKFRQLLPLLTSRGLSLHTRGKIYSTYIRPALHTAFHWLLLYFILIIGRGTEAL